MHWHKLLSSCVSHGCRQAFHSNLSQPLHSCRHPLRPLSDTAHLLFFTVSLPDTCSNWEDPTQHRSGRLEIAAGVLTCRCPSDTLLPTLHQYATRLKGALTWQTAGSCRPSRLPCVQPAPSHAQPWPHLRTPGWTPLPGVPHPLPVPGGARCWRGPPCRADSRA